MPRIVLLLTTLLMVGQGFVKAQDCTSDVHFAFVDSQEVVFYNTSASYTRASWDAGDALVLHQHDEAIVVRFEAFPATVCLAISNDSGCADTTCVEVFPGAPGDMCQTEDCIWPGDANGDGAANNYDLIHIGMGFGSQGAQRTHFPIPDDPMAWLPNFGADWQGDVAGINYKHFDSDGNGLVEEADVTAILHNYRPDFDYQTPQNATGPWVLLEPADSMITIDPGSSDPVEVRFRVRLGTEQFPVDDIHGIAFSLDYPISIVEPGSPAVTYVDTSFFGSPEQVLTLDNDLFSNSLGRVDVALSSRAGRLVDGFGIIFETSFIIVGDIAVGKGRNIIPFDVSISKIGLIDSQGNRIQVQIENKPSSIGIEIGTVTSTRPDPALGQLFTLFPNPASGTSRLGWDEAQPETVRVLDALGRIMLATTPVENYLDIHTAAWPPGLYHVQIRTREGLAVKKLIVR